MGSTKVWLVTCGRSDLSRLDLGNGRELSELRGRWRRRPRVVIEAGRPFWLTLVGAGANMMNERARLARRCRCRGGRVGDGDGMDRQGGIDASGA